MARWLKIARVSALTVTVGQKKNGKLVSLLIFFTAAVWCVPFSGAVGLFNKLQTQKKKDRPFRVPLITPQRCTWSPRLRACISEGRPGCARV